MYNFRNKFKQHDTAKGRKAAIVVQRHVRGYHMRKVLADMKYGIRAILRVKSALKIQSVVRRFSDKRLVKNLRKLRHYAALSIQRVMRSFLCRQFLLFDRAARKVTGFMRMVYQQRWTAAVFAVSDLKRNLNENEIAAVTIQCFIRRFLAGRLVSRSCCFWSICTASIVYISNPILHNSHTLLFFLLERIFLIFLSNHSNHCYLITLSHHLFLSLLLVYLKV